MTDDLVAFLRARLDEDEQLARTAMWAGDEHWTAYEFKHASDTWHVDDSYDEGVAQVRAQAADSEAVARHIALHDPARVITDVAAKRAIIDAYEQAEQYAEVDGWDAANNGLAAGLGLAIRFLAVVYAERDDYRPEWTPEAGT